MKTDSLSFRMSPARRRMTSSTAYARPPDFWPTKKYFRKGSIERGGGGRYKRSYFASVAPRRLQFTSFDAGLISRTQICNKSPWQKHPELWCFLLFQIIPFYMNHLLLNSGYTQWHTNYTSSTGSLNFDVYLGVTVILV